MSTLNVTRPSVSQSSSSWLTPLARMTWIELKLFLREPAAAFFTLVLPVLLLVLNGSVSGNERSADLGGAGPIDILVPGYIALVIATLGLTNLPGLLATYRENGVLRRLQATPVRPGTILVAHLLVHALIATLGLVILLVLATTVFGLRAPASPAAVLVGYIVSVIGFAGFGFVLAAVLPTARSTSAISFAIYLPMIFLSGATWPREALPDWAQRIASALPLTYVVEAIKRPWVTGEWHTVALLMLGLMVVAGTVLSGRLFRWS
jgi:ABC-2 type transport system permease protein